MQSTKRIAYVRGGFRAPDVDAAIGAGRHPRQDYTLLLDRRSLTCISYDDVERAHPGLSSILASQQLLEWAPAVLMREEAARYDVVISSAEDVGLPLALSAQLHRLRHRILIITHGFLARAEAVVRQLADMPNLTFLCISSQLRTMVVERIGVDPARVRTVGWGVDTDFFRPSRAPDRSGRPHIVSAGLSNRDYPTLIRAVRGMKVRVTIAADSPWCPSPLGPLGDLPDHVEVRSSGSYEALRDLYATASLIVVPLRPAPFACGYAVSSEAMAMGRPLIVTRTAGHSDFVEDGLSGLYVRPCDAVDLRDKIASLLEDPERAEMMGDRARARIASCFSHTSYCNRLDAAIDAALS